MNFEREYHVRRVAAPRPIVAKVPGSKSITNRALLIAALCEGTSVLTGVLFSDDSRHFIRALSDLGFSVEADEAACTVAVTGLGGRLPRAQASVDVGSAGTAARFLTALLAVSDGCYQMDSSEQMRRRPMGELLRALEELGAGFVFGGEEDHFPFTVIGRGCRQQEERCAPDGAGASSSADGAGASSSADGVGASSGADGAGASSSAGGTEASSGADGAGASSSADGTEASSGAGRMEVTVDVEKSSQFLSALLIVSVLFEQDVCIHVRGKHGMAYVELTVRMMEQFGVRVQKIGDAYCVSRHEGYAARPYQIEPDLSAACYFYAAGAVLGVPAKVKGVYSSSMQGDLAFLHVLEDLGCRMEEQSDGICLIPPDRESQGTTLYVPKERACDGKLVAEEQSEGICLIPSDRECEQGTMLHVPKERACDGKLVAEEQSEGICLIPPVGKRRQGARLHVPKERACSGGFITCEKENGSSLYQGSFKSGQEDGELSAPVGWDLSAFSDQALTLAAIAPFADAPIAIRGIGHIRFQECDRIRAICGNLSAMGVECVEKDGTIVILPPVQGEAFKGMEDVGSTNKDEGMIPSVRNSVNGATIQTWEDHRVAMAFTIPGLVLDGQVIENPGCCAKTFEGFFEELERAVYG